MKHPVFTKRAINSLIKNNITVYCDVFLTVHHSIELLHQPTLIHNFLYSLTICWLHYYPRHVSSINMPIFRGKNCIHTASGIFVLCKRLHSTLVERVDEIILLQCIVTHATSMYSWLYKISSEI